MVEVSSSYEKFLDFFKGEPANPEVNYDKAPTTLFQNIQSSDWKACIKHAKDYPKEVRTWVFREDESGRSLWRTLPLHAAIMSHCPLSVVKAFLKIYPEGAKKKDDQKNLPIHLVANNFDPDNKIISALLEAYPKGLFKLNPNNGISLADYDLSCPGLYKLIQSKNWDGVKMHAYDHPFEAKVWVFRRQDGKIKWRLLPLHAAIMFNAPKGVIDALLVAFPESVRCFDDEGMTPIQRELKKYTHKDDRLDVMLKAITYPLGVITYTDDGKQKHVLADHDRDCTLLYKLIKMEDWDEVLSRLTTNPEEAQTWVMQREIYGEDLAFRHLPIHAALLLKAPYSVIEAMLTVYPEAIRCCDIKGLLPIQIALDRFSRGDDMIDLLLEALEDPESITVKDDDGNVILVNYDISSTRLYELIEARSWDECINYVMKNPMEAKTWVMRKRNNGKLKWRLLPIHAAVILKAPCSVVQALLLAYPDSASCRDDQGMLPYHLAKWKKLPNDVLEVLDQANPDACNESVCIESISSRTEATGDSRTEATGDSRTEATGDSRTEATSECAES